MPRTHCAWVLVVYLCLITPTTAATRFQLNLDAIETPAWRLSKVRLDMLRRQDGRLDLKVFAAQLSFLNRPLLSDLEFRCMGALLDSEHIVCPRGFLALTPPLLGRADGRLALRHRFSDSTTRIRVEPLVLPGGTGRLTAHLRKRDWDLRVDLLNLGISKLDGLIKHFNGALQARNAASGQMDLHAELRGTGSHIRFVRLASTLRGLNFSGVQAAEEVDGDLQFRAERHKNTWSIAGDLKLSSGQVYIEPGFSISDFVPGFTLKVLKTPLTLAVSANWDEFQGRWDIEKAHLDHPGVINLQLVGTLQPGQKDPLRSLQVKAQAPDLKSAYGGYLQPLLVPYGLGTLEMKGGVDLELRIEHNRLRELALALNGLSFNDSRGRFWASAVNGRLILHSGDHPLRSRLRWAGAGFYRLPLGPAQVTLESAKQNLQLIQGGRWPILDGELRFENLRLEKVGSSDFSLRLDGVLSPIALADFCRAMDWPLFSGKLSGILPGLYYQGNRLRIGGTLLVQVFDGRIVVQNLRIDELFGPVPRLKADILIRELDLASLTSALSFGKIEGRLSGSIKRLHLEDWQPVYFEAEMATPENDNSRHRISQRALDNLTDLGGGMTVNAVSRALLRVFNEFSYDRLGIKCRLQKGICEMDGLESTDGGYAIVKPGLLPPWLEVNGFNRTVDWKVLIGRMKEIMRGKRTRVQ